MTGHWCPTSATEAVGGGAGRRHPGRGVGWGGGDGRGWRATGSIRSRLSRGMGDPARDGRVTTTRFSFWETSSPVIRSPFFRKSTTDLGRRAIPTSQSAMTKPRSDPRPSNRGNPSLRRRGVSLGPGRLRPFRRVVVRAIDGAGRRWRGSRSICVGHPDADLPPLIQDFELRPVSLPVLPADERSGSPKHMIGVGLSRVPVTNMEMGVPDP